MLHDEPCVLNLKLFHNNYCVNVIHNATMQKLTLYNSKSSTLGSLSCARQRTSSESYLSCPLYIFLFCWNIPTQTLKAWTSLYDFFIQMFIQLDNRLSAFCCCAIIAYPLLHAIIVHNKAGIESRSVNSWAIHRAWILINVWKLAAGPNWHVESEDSRQLTPNGVRKEAGWKIWMIREWLHRSNNTGQEWRRWKLTKVHVMKNLLGVPNIVF